MGRTVFKGTLNRMVNGYLLRDVVNAEIKGLLKTGK
jgi:hypothetical protein